MPEPTDKKLMTDQEREEGRAAFTKAMIRSGVPEIVRRTMASMKEDMSPCEEGNVRDITDGQIIRILDSFSEEHPAGGERWGFDTALGDTAKLIRVVRRILSTREEGDA